MGREMLCVFAQPHRIINHICPLHIDDHRCNPVSFFSHFFTPVLAHHHLRLHAMHPCLHEITSRICTWSVFFFSFYPFHLCPQLSRPVLPDRELTKGGSAIMLGCQQRARAMKLRYVAWWWRSRERKPTRFGNGFGCCLASVSTSRRESE